MDIGKLVSEGWGDHDKDTAGVAARLVENINAVSNIDDGMKFLGLATHVYGEHMGEWSEGLNLIDHLMNLESLKDDRKWLSATWRAKAWFQMANGDAGAGDESLARAVGYSEESEASNRIRVLAMAGAAMIAQKQVAKGMGLYEQAIQLYDANNVADDDPSVRSMAITSNNLAWELDSVSGRDAVQTEMMLKAAFGARKFWEKAGGWTEVERAEYCLSRIHASAGQFDRAVDHGEKCLTICEENKAGSSELFFAYEALSYAWSLKGDDEKAKSFMQKVETAMANVDESWKGYCEGCFAKLKAAIGS